jgi:hypothetical protein
MSFIFELDHVQTTLLTDLLDRIDQRGEIPAGKGAAFFAVRSQLANPQDAREVVERIKAQAAREAQEAAAGLPLATPAAPNVHHVQA